MNCRNFQNKLYDFLDGTLPPWSRARARSHLARCPQCRMAVEKEQRLARILGEHFDKAMQDHRLDREILRRVQSKFDHQPAQPARQVFWAAVSMLRRRGMPAALVGTLMVLVAGSVVLRNIQHGPGNRRAQNLPTATPAADAILAVEISYPNPRYIFRREGDFVVDALCYQTNVVKQTLWVGYQKPRQTKRERKLPL